MSESLSNWPDHHDGNRVDINCDIETVFKNFLVLREQESAKDDPRYSYEELHGTAIYEHFSDTALTITQYEATQAVDIHHNNSINTGKYYLDGAALGINIGKVSLGKYFDEELCDVRSSVQLPDVDSSPHVSLTVAINYLLHEGKANYEAFIGPSVANNAPNISRERVQFIVDSLGTPTFGRRYFYAGLGDSLALVQNAQSAFTVEHNAFFNSSDFHVETE